MKRLFLSTLLLLASASLAPASFISGFLLFSDVEATLVGTNVHNATGIDFINPVDTGLGFGDYEEIPQYTDANFSDLNFGAVGNLDLGTNIVQLWSFSRVARSSPSA